jgi:hypothetical protein
MRRLSTHPGALSGRRIRRRTWPDVAAGALGSDRVELTVTPLDPHSFTPLKTESAIEATDFDESGIAGRRRTPKRIGVAAVVILAAVVVVAAATTCVTHPTDHHVARPASPAFFDAAARPPQQPTLPACAPAPRVPAVQPRRRADYARAGTASSATVTHEHVNVLCEISEQPSHVHELQHLLDVYREDLRADTQCSRPRAIAVVMPARWPDSPKPHSVDERCPKRDVSGINVPLRATAIEQGWTVNCWMEEPAWSRPPRGGLGPHKSTTSGSRAVRNAATCRVRPPG